VFHTDVVKVDRDVAHVVMVVHICCKLMFSMFHLFFPTDIACVFTHMMMQVFYLDVAYVYNGFKCFSDVFANVLNTCFKCFICFQTNVAIIASGCT
jgi:hypothetical protein